MRVDILFSIKKFFSFSTLTPSQSGWNPCVYRGFSGEGKCEGKCVSPHTLMDKPCICKRYRLRLLRRRLSNILPLIKQVPHTCKIRPIRPISVRKKIYSRMNYINLTTNLPNPTNIYHVATQKDSSDSYDSCSKKTFAYELYYVDH